MILWTAAGISLALSLLWAFKDGPTASDFALYGIGMALLYIGDEIEKLRKRGL